MGNVHRHIHGQRCSTDDEAIARVAASQYGVISRDQLRALDLTDDQIDHRTRCRRLHGLYRGVYAVGNPRVTIEGRRLASVLTYGDDAAVSDRAAAAHWNLRQSSAIEVTVPRKVRKRSGLLVHTRPLPPDETTTHEGIRVTSVTRTIFDLAPLGEKPVKNAMAKAEYLQLTDPLSLAALVERYEHRPHTGVIRNALSAYQAGTGITANELEEAFDTFLDDRGFPPRERNAWIQLGTKWIKGDFVFREQRVIVETDGGIHRTVFTKRSDDARDRAAAAHNWRVLRVTPWALDNEADEIDADLRKALDG